MKILPKFVLSCIVCKVNLVTALVISYRTVKVLAKGECLLPLREGES